MQSDPDPKQNDKSKIESDSLPNLWKVIDPSPNERLGTYMVLGILLAIVSSVPIPLNIHYIRVLVLSLIEAEKHPKSFAHEIKLDVHQFMVISCVLGAVTFICTYLAVILINYVVTQQVYRIRHKLFRAVLDKDLAWFDDQQPKEIVSRMDEYVSEMENAMGDAIAAAAFYYAMFLGLIADSIIAGYSLAVIALLGFFPITSLLIYGANIEETINRDKDIKSEYAKAGAIVADAIGLIRTVVAFNGQKKESERYAKQLASVRAISFEKHRFNGALQGLFRGFALGWVAFTMWLGTKWIFDRDLVCQLFDVGNVLSINVSMMLIFGFIDSIWCASLPFLTLEKTAVKIVNIIERTSTDEMQDNSEQHIPDSFEGMIEFRNIVFGHPSRAALDNFNLTVNKGEMVALVGASGCGKTTCIQLIQRFYNPDHGEVLLDGTNVQTLDANWLRSQIGFVEQEPFLFAASIYENIAYGNAQATAREIENAARLANAHEFIARLPDQYHTLIGEKGVALSVGQKQRIAFARALVRGPGILLLDESTTAFGAALRTACRGRTTIVVGNRLSTTRYADRIVVLDKGKVVEMGTHSELMMLKGHYHALVPATADTSDVDGKPSHNVNFLQTSVEDVYIVPSKVSACQVLAWNCPELVCLLFGSIGCIIMGVALPLLGAVVGQTIALFTSKDEQYIRKQVGYRCIAFGIISFAYLLAVFLKYWLFGIAGVKLMERLCANAFSSLLRQEIAWITDQSNGMAALCSSLSPDTKRDLTVASKMGLILAAISALTAALSIAAWLNMNLAYILLAFTLVIIVVFILEYRLTARAAMSNEDALEECAKFAVETMSSMRTIISLGLQNQIYDRYLELLKKSKAPARKIHFRGIVLGVARSIVIFALSACFCFGGPMLLDGSLTIESLLVVTLAFLTASTTTHQAVSQAVLMRRGLCLYSKINQIIKRKPLIADPEDTHLIPPLVFRGKVFFQRVDFSYPSQAEKKVLKGFNIDVQSGKSFALVGPSGSGKSTAMLLLLRFYDPTRGTVWLDGHLTTLIPLATLRSMVAIVTDEPGLFDRTIAENIAYGDTSRKVLLTEIINIAQLVNINDFVVSLPLGYETRLGDKNCPPLSPGLSRCIAIARALVRKPKVIVFDEPTSGLDTQDEALVRRAMAALAKGRTCITVTQRLSTIVNSDIIFVVNEGKVIERGTHRQLLDLNGMYSDLHALQRRAEREPPTL